MSGLVDALTNKIAGIFFLRNANASDEPGVLVEKVNLCNTFRVARSRLQKYSTRVKCVPARMQGLKGGCTNKQASKLKQDVELEKHLNKTIALIIKDNAIRLANMTYLMLELQGHTTHGDKVYILFNRMSTLLGPFDPLVTNSSLDMHQSHLLHTRLAYKDLHNYKWTDTMDRVLRYLLEAEYDLDMLELSYMTAETRSKALGFVALHRLVDKTKFHFNKIDLTVDKQVLTFLPNNVQDKLRALAKSLESLAMDNKSDLKTIQAMYLDATYSSLPGDVQEQLVDIYLSCKLLRHQWTRVREFLLACMVRTTDSTRCTMTRSRL